VRAALTDRHQAHRETGREAGREHIWLKPLRSPLCVAWTLEALPLTLWVGLLIFSPRAVVPCLDPRPMKLPPERQQMKNTEDIASPEGRHRARIRPRSARANI
jgi:hypothetical protein